ncbi:MAG: hypothetical protein LC118_13205 [Dehalococcoidia bacterium]|nr:hypothetical protein [Dehalococcoidia bacterium]
MQTSRYLVTFFERDGGHVASRRVVTASNVSHAADIARGREISYCAEYGIKAPGAERCYVSRIDGAPLQCRRDGLDCTEPGTFVVCVFPASYIEGRSR